MNTCVVTGAAGFAGCNLTEALIEGGYNVIAVLRRSSPHNDRLKELMSSGRLTALELDAKDLELLPERIGSLRPDTFYHLLWSGERDDFESQRQNIDYTLSAVKAASALGVKRFICTGSQAEYGITGLRQTEEMCPKPQNAYGAAKTAALYLSRRLSMKLNMEWIWGRIFSLYGKYEHSRTLVQYILNCNKNGEDIHVTEALQNWDYLDARDCAKALIALGEKGRNGEIYNIASGSYRPLRDYIELLCKGSGQRIFYDKKAEETVSLQPDVSKILGDTGWKAGIPFGEYFKSNDI